MKLSFLHNSMEIIYPKIALIEATIVSYKYCIISRIELKKFSTLKSYEKYSTSYKVGRDWLFWMNYFKKLKHIFLKGHFPFCTQPTCASKLSALFLQHNLALFNLISTLPNRKKIISNWLILRSASCLDLSILQSILF